MEIINNEIEQLARKFLAEKSRKNYYEVVALDEDILEERRFLHEIDDERIKAFCDLREKYGEEEFVKHLGEVITEADELHDFSLGCEVLKFNIDSPYHQYSFGCHELVGESLCKKDVLVEMDDEAYVQLLALCVEDKDMNVNKLRYANEGLYRLVVREVDGYFCDDLYYCGKHPYLITMDEIREDANRILAECPEVRQWGYKGYSFM